MDDAQLLRYSRQILLPQINLDGQQQLAQKTVLIIGLGGLGSPVAMYLAAAGVGHLILVDGDRVDLSNLQRQIIHDTPHIGFYKSISAQIRLQALNPEIKLTTFTERFSGENLTHQIKAADVVVDCSDNFATRFMINATCLYAKKPLVSGAVIRFTGQVTTFLPENKESPCYCCLYPEEGETEETCSQTGIIAPLAGIIGSIQAVETLKILLNIGQILCGKLLLLDAYTMEWRTLKLRKDPHCPLCSSFLSKSPL